MRVEIPLQDEWPGKESAKQLILKADGLFIYAVTACRFLGAATSEKLANLRLDTILDDEVDLNSPQQNIDSIYTQTLKFSVSTKSKRKRQKY